MKKISILFLLGALPAFFASSCGSDHTVPDSKYLSRIFSINPDGTNRTAITLGWSFSLLPGGKMIYCNDALKLHICNTDGSGIIDITPGGFQITNYQLYMNKTKIFFFQDFLYYTMNIDGSGLQEFQIPGGFPFISEVQISPGGGSVAFTNYSGLYYINRDGSELRQIKNTTDTSLCYDIKFTPDSKSIVYIYDNRKSNAVDLRLYNLETNKDTSLFYNDGGNKVRAFSVSEWNKVLFANGDGINIVDLNDYSHVFLHKGYDPYPSGDSTLITFMDDQGTGIYVMNIEDNSAVFADVGLPNNFVSHPVLLNDGSLLFQADTSWVIQKAGDNGNGIVY